MTILLTGGAGFIGSNFVLDWLAQTDETIINLDCLSYASDGDNLVEVNDNPGYIFVKGNITDIKLVTDLLEEHRPRAILNFAAESHVDRSIGNPSPFIESNIVGTFRLVEAARQYLSLHSKLSDSFRFMQISTDEVFGSLARDESAFVEESNYKPNSPYSASKASADHLVRSYFHTYGLSTLTSNCSNNFGPHQHTEKFIPVVINNALSLNPIPVYGDGRNVRDWLYVSDHCQALRLILEKGTPGETYLVGGDCEKSNNELALAICTKLDEIRPRNDGQSYATLITQVADRPGHDLRYAVDSKKTQTELGWRKQESFESGLDKTIDWYLSRFDQRQ